MAEKYAKRKRYGIKRLYYSFKYSVEGLVYAYKNEQSMGIHMCACILVIIMGFYFNITHIEWLFLFLIIGLIFGLELVNTSIEAVVDLVSPEKHPLAKIAKDTAAAAVFSLTIVSILGGFLIFIPKILELIV